MTKKLSFKAAEDFFIVMTDQLLNSVQFSRPG